MYRTVAASEPWRTEIGYLNFIVKPQAVSVWSRSVVSISRLVVYIPFAIKTPEIENECEYVNLYRPSHDHENVTNREIVAHKSLS